MLSQCGRESLPSCHANRCGKSLLMQHGRKHCKGRDGRVDRIDGGEGHMWSRARGGGGW